MPGIAHTITNAAKPTTCHALFTSIRNQRNGRCLSSHTHAHNKAGRRNKLSVCTHCNHLSELVAVLSTSLNNQPTLTTIVNTIISPIHRTILENIFSCFILYIFPFSATKVLQNLHTYKYFSIFAKKSHSPLIYFFLCRHIDESTANRE